MAGTRPGTTKESQSVELPRSPRSAHRGAAHSAPASYLEVLGHLPVGPVRLRRDVRGSARRGRMADATAGRAVRYCRCGSRGLWWGDDFTFGHYGTACRDRRVLDRHPRLAHAICGISRAALAVVERASDRHRRPGRAGRGVGSAVACAGTRNPARLYGRRAEIGAGRWRAVAIGGRVLHRSADVGGVLGSRFSLPWLVRSFLRPAGAIVLSSMVWTAMHLQYDWFFFGEVFSIGLLLGYLRYRSNSTWLTVVVHGVNNLAATVQTIWIAGSS